MTQMTMRVARAAVSGLLLALLAAAPLQAAINLPDFTGLVEQHSPAVVNISTKQKIAERQRMQRPPNLPELPEGTPFGDLFRHFFGEEGEGGSIPEHETQSLGSGLILSSDGYVVTNAHVIRDAEEIIVRLSDRRQLVAKVIGSDPRSDVALLKIEADDLPVVKLGDSDKLKVGAWVLAIGSPFGFDYSVTAGIVSAKGRSLPRENYVPFIQTDVAINPGNSGGPLFNLDGEVVGINSQIYSRTGGFMGLSFAIPVNVVMDVVEQLKSSGRVSRGWLGILIQDVTRELAEAFGMSKPQGALVSKVLDDSPAAAAGFMSGDVVIRFDGREVADSASLPALVGRVRAGKEVEVVVMREGKERTLKVTIGELPSDEELAQAVEPEVQSVAEKRLGVKATAVPDALREALELAEGGVLVESVEDGPAARAGVREGDVIVMVNQQAVSDPEQFAGLIDSLPAGKSVALRIQRRNGPLWLALRLDGEGG
ncbi:MAG TPA: DegQ family serine endoprotease [Gammaproteobacteria bacterium]